MTGAVLDRRKLVGVLGLLGSEHDGEIAAAGRAANAMLQKVGISWADVIAPDGPEAAPINLDGLIRFCFDWGNALTVWERDFLRSVERQRHRLSDKQTATLIQIADRVRACADVWVE
jgi:hypothetical protein